MSAITARSPLTMAPMRVAGTRKAIAKALTDIASGLRNSSLSTSPGWAFTRLGVAMALVVVDDFDIGRSFFGPGETDTPLVVDPDRVLSPTAAGQRLQPVCRWCAQVVELPRGMKHVEFSQRLLFYSAEALDKFAHPQEAVEKKRVPKDEKDMAIRLDARLLWPQERDSLFDALAPFRAAATVAKQRDPEHD